MVNFKEVKSFNFDSLLSFNRFYSIDGTEIREILLARRDNHYVMYLVVSEPEKEDFIRCFKYSKDTCLSEVNARYGAIVDFWFKNGYRPA